MAKLTVMLLGATGTIGRATYLELKSEGHDVVAPVRTGSDTAGLSPDDVSLSSIGDILASKQIDAVISCVASRTGLDAWEVDYELNSRALAASVKAGIERFVLLSAICVQKPRLAFQHAKLAFEAELRASPLTWSIVRPTAYFKSLSGQLDRVRAGKPFLLFGSGHLTACKPISDRDTARFLVRCLTDANLSGRILPVGGPGPAITPHTQGKMLCDALGVAPKFAHVPIGVMRAITIGLGAFGIVSKRLQKKAELARIGHYYATESMLVWDSAKQTYDAEQTPEFGSDVLIDHYRRLAEGHVRDDRGTHAVF